MHVNVRAQKTLISVGDILFFYAIRVLSTGRNSQFEFHRGESMDIERSRSFLCVCGTMQLQLRLFSLMFVIVGAKEESENRQRVNLFLLFEDKRERAICLFLCFRWTLRFN
jgi:hypothetical protein